MRHPRPPCFELDCDTQVPCGDLLSQLWARWAPLHAQLCAAGALGSNASLCLLRGRLVVGVYRQGRSGGPYRVNRGSCLAWPIQDGLERHGECPTRMSHHYSSGRVCSGHVSPVRDVARKKIYTQNKHICLLIVIYKGVPKGTQRCQTGSRAGQRSSRARFYKCKTEPWALQPLSVAACGRKRHRWDASGTQKAAHRLPKESPGVQKEAHGCQNKPRGAKRAPKRKPRGSKKVQKWSPRANGNDNVYYQQT